MPGLTRKEKKRRAERQPETATGPPRKHQKKRRSFDDHCRALVVYKSENGHINVPSHYDKDTALGKWVNTTRSSQGTKLTPQQKTRLTDLGFVWETKKQKNEKQWSAMLEKLQEYRSIHFDCCVPGGWPSDPQLGRWVSTQRTKKANNELQPHHKQQLDAINFQWRLRAAVKRDSSTNDEKWFNKYQMLIEYREEHGDCLVSQMGTGGPDAELALWVNRQRINYRNGMLKEGRKKWLNEIGFVYTFDNADPNASQTQKQWDKMCEHLVEFKEEHGHVDVKQSYSKWGLGKWVDTQRIAGRKGRLDQRRAVRLQEIGITWGKRRDERWEEGFAMLDEYRKNYAAPKGSPTGRKLGKESSLKLSAWVRRQRRVQATGSLLPERKARLDAIGFFWRSRKLSFDDNHSDEEGTTSAPMFEYESDAATGSSEEKTSTQTIVCSANVRSTPQRRCTTENNKIQSHAASTSQKGSIHVESDDSSDSEFEFEG